MNEPVKLTQYSRGAGCGCKIAPQVLQQMINIEEQDPEFPNLLVGNRSFDDAAVYALEGRQAIISTADFFMPIVDDAFDFGRIAAANSLSDVYAMGGRPIMALGLLGWPVEKLAPELAGKVIAGAKTVCAEANIPLAGGHTIDSAEPFFGLSVNGLIDTAYLKKNNTAEAGHLIYITKPIGTGIYSTALKRAQLDAEDQSALLEQLCRLNSIGAELGKYGSVTAMTDITGFGLLGHLMEMCKGAGLSAELNYSAIPLMPNLQKYLALKTIPDATFRNWNAYSKDTGFAKGVNVMEAFNVLPDPQTNGGLMIAVHPDQRVEIEELFRQNNLASFAAPIGKFITQADKIVNVLP